MNCTISRKTLSTPFLSSRAPDGLRMVLPLLLKNLPTWILQAEKERGTGNILRETKNLLQTDRPHLYLVGAPSRLSPT